MMLLDLLFDIVINIYTSLGYGTKEHKIESKMEKIKTNHPKAYEIYLHNKAIFETDTELSEKIMHLNLKNKMAVNNIVKEIFTHFAMAA
ncbi:hypothetical protein [Solibacillus sp. CAU 1738]|uniref:hypothetical protein n=1 Tax=Solibacillus sp. CAU 1738 TaxID=3140363 RepID=UPI0032617E26